MLKVTNAKEKIELIVEGLLEGERLAAVVVARGGEVSDQRRDSLNAMAVHHALYRAGYDVDRAFADVRAFMEDVLAGQRQLRDSYPVQGRAELLLISLEQRGFTFVKGTKKVHCANGHAYASEAGYRYCPQDGLPLT